MMIRFTAVAALAFFAAACGNTQAQDSMSEEEIGGIVREYLLKNPEVIRDALIELQRREAAQEMQGVRDAIKESQDQLVDPRAPSLGPETAEITIVEFFDYNCGYCRLSADWVKKTLEKYPEQVRVVFRDYPILESRSGTSVEALKAAHAAQNQDLFKEFHFALMGASGNLTSQRIYEIAGQVGLDIDQLKADMKNENVEDLISDTLVLGAEVGINGTPFFVIGDQIVTGADMETLDEALDSELSS